MSEKEEFSIKDWVLQDNIHKFGTIAASVLVVAIIVVGIIVGGKDKKLDLALFTEYELSGVESNASMTYRIKEDELGYAYLGEDRKDNVNLYEASECISSIIITADKDSSLSNGDTVKLDIKQKDGCSIFKDSTLSVTVEGLEEGLPLSDEELKDNVIAEFAGSSGKGTVSIKSLFKETLANLDFEANKLEAISNGDTINIKLTEQSVIALGELGYKLTGTGNFDVKASGLSNIPSSIDDYGNKDDVLRLLKEKIDDKLRYSTFEYSSNLYYSQFVVPGAEVNGNWSNTFTDGSLGYIVEYTGFGDKTNYQFYGFDHIELNEEGNVDLNKLTVSSYSFPESYSIETVDKILISDGFKEINE